MSQALPWPPKRVTATLAVTELAGFRWPRSGRACAQMPPGSRVGDRQPMSITPNLALRRCANAGSPGLSGPGHTTHTLLVTELASHLWPRSGIACAQLHPGSRAGGRQPMSITPNPVLRRCASTGGPGLSGPGHTTSSVPAEATCNPHSCSDWCPLPLRMASTRSRRSSLMSFHQATMPALTTVSLQLDTELAKRGRPCVADVRAAVQLRDTMSS